MRSSRPGPVPRRRRPGQRGRRREPTVVTSAARPRPARPRAAPAVRRSAADPSPTPTSSTVRAARSPGTSGMRVTDPASALRLVGGLTPAPRPGRPAPGPAATTPVGGSPPVGDGQRQQQVRRVEVGQDVGEGRRRETVHALAAGVRRSGAGTEPTLPTAGRAAGIRPPHDARTPTGRSRWGSWTNAFSGSLEPSQLSMASPRARTSSGVISTTRRPPPSSGMRSTMPRPSLVTSSGPSPVLGFIAAMSVSLPYGVVSCWARGSTPVLCSSRARQICSIIP